jgi:undecaprenyl-diphosphatase
MLYNFTGFAANYLIFVDLLAAAVVIAYAAYRRPRRFAFRWAVAACAILLLSYVFAQLGAAAYNDPRPFVVEHTQPLVPHAVDNGFPSDHALLASALFALVALIDIPLSLPFALLALIIDLSRVGAGVHHPFDVVGSSIFVALASVVALLIRPVLVRWLVPRLPRWITGEPNPTT